MSIPLDNLYHYIENIAQEVHGDVVIYRFYPDGSKKLEDLNCLHNLDWYNMMTRPPLICHDQEPLNFDFYENYKIFYNFFKLLKKHNLYKPLNLKKNTIFDSLILLHSEKQSSEVEKYCSEGFISTYYWSHAFIALDWFRFANHINQQKHANKTFLIYNRAWAGTREYRIKFVDLLFEHNLVNHCQTKFNCIDPDQHIHYKNHTYQNKIWIPKNNLSNIFETNPTPTTMSADFNIKDYESTEIEIVLETLFDDSRIHLTEKSLRPIACEQPFILAGPAGSLSYLKQYGFKTFDGIWDETYDCITDPSERLQSIIKLMNEIVSWDVATKEKKLQQARQVSKFNKEYFFSHQFFNKINLELKTNLKKSLQELTSNNTSKKWLDRRKELSHNLEIKNIITGKSTSPDLDSMDIFLRNTYFKKTEIVKVLREARKYYLRSLSQDNKKQ